MQTYAYLGSQAHYNIEGQVFSYTKNLKNNDADLMDIIAPSLTNDYMKYNPSCTGPIIKLRNAGSANLTKATIEYGITGGMASTYNWSGNLLYNQNETVQLPAIPEAELWADSSRFYAKIKSANNSVDANIENDINYSIYKAVPKLPNYFVIRMKTNNTDSSYTVGINETSWRLIDANNNVVKERINCKQNTMHFDTILIGPGCYKLIVKDTGYADGINFWYYPNYSTNPSIGSITFLDAATGAGISQTVSKLNTKYYGGDFGAGFTYDFKIVYPSGTNNFLNSTFEVEVFPNPSTANINVHVVNISSPTTINLLNIEGKIMDKIMATENKIYSFNTLKLANGFYTVQIISKDGMINRKVILNK
jgi:Secretion system C-terminal sorting domain